MPASFEEPQEAWKFHSKQKLSIHRNRQSSVGYLHRYDARKNQRIDVAAAGGWRSVETVQRIYQRAEAEGVLSAIQTIGGGG